MLQSHATDATPNRADIDADVAAPPNRADIDAAAAQPDRVDIDAAAQPEHAADTLPHPNRAAAPADISASAPPPSRVDIDAAASATPTPPPLPAAARRSSPARRLLAFALVVGFAAGLAALLAYGLANRAAPTGRSGETRVGNPAPPISLALYDGGFISPQQYGGKPLVVNFWASWCGPCRQEAALLERMSREYAPRGVTFIGVNIQDEESAARAYLSEFGVTYPNGADVDGATTVDYGVIGIPVTFFVNRDGVVERRWVGAAREAQLRQWIDDLAAGTAPAAGEAEAQNPEGYRPLR